MTERLQRLKRISGPVSRETFERLEEFEVEFVRWSARINLTASSTLAELWDRHILDSAQLRPLAPQALRWLDLGSGGGFPGVVMALLLRETPDAHIDLVESTAKKAAFLQAVLAKLDVPAVVHRDRIERVVIETPEIVTARALAPLPRLLELSSRWLCTGARALFHKGRGYSSELEEIRNVWRFDLVEHPSAVGDGVILDIANLRRI